MQKIGLVLSGGGAKGAYQVGVIKALDEYGFTSKIKAISGSSIGAVNACLFLQYSADDLMYIWTHLKWNHVLNIEEAGYRQLMNSQMQLNKMSASKIKAAGEMLGIAKRLGLPLKRHNFEGAINYFLDYDTIRHHVVNCYIGCENINQNRPYYFLLNNKSNEQMKDVILASIAIPFIYKPVRIGNGLYQDPLKSENVPLRPLLSEDCDMIFIVNLDVFANQKIPMIRKTKHTTLVTISPSRVISKTFQGALDFTESTIINQFRLGYEDATKALEMIKGMDTVESIM